MGKDLNNYLPLSEATTYILLCLVEPAHGYAIMQQVEAMTAGKIKIGPGTLYGALSTLESEKMILMVSEEERRKCYRLTERGRALLRGQIDRLEMLQENYRAILGGLME